MPCLVLAILSDENLRPEEVLLTFTIYLEAVAILPQAQFAANSKRPLPSIVSYYVAALAVYTIFRLTYGIRHFYMDEPHRRRMIAGEIIQLIFYFDFFLRGQDNTPREVEEQIKSKVVTVVVDGKNHEDHKSPAEVSMKDVYTVVLPPCESTDKASFILI